LAWELKSFHSLGTGVAVKLYGLLAAEALKINGLPGPNGVVGCDKLEKLWIGPAKIIPFSLNFYSPEKQERTVNFKTTNLHRLVSVNDELLGI
jgi:hypothetical protein